MYLCISLSSYMYLRGWRYTAKLVLFEIEISKSTKPYPSVSREYTNRMGRCFLLVVSQETSMRFPTVFRQPLIFVRAVQAFPRRDSRGPGDTMFVIVLDVHYRPVFLESLLGYYRCSDYHCRNCCDNCHCCYCYCCLLNQLSSSSSSSSSSLQLLPFMILVIITYIFRILILVSLL